MLYENQSHETIGSDLRAVLHTMKSPEEILGAYWVQRLAGVLPTQWYPVATLLELQQQVLHRGGRAFLMEMGRQLFRDSHQKRLGPTLQSAGDVLFGLNRMYRFANRGLNIGGWEVLTFGPGHGVLRKKTPHHCALDEGFLHEALQVVGAVVVIVQPSCELIGGKSCELELRSPLRGPRWMGTHPAKQS
jgi:hypothetical protein